MVNDIENPLRNDEHVAVHLSYEPSRQETGRLTVVSEDGADPLGTHFRALTDFGQARRTWCEGPSSADFTTSGTFGHEGPYTSNTATTSSTLPVVVLNITPPQVKPENPVTGGALHAPTSRSWVIQYFRKWGGVAGERPMPRPPWHELIWTFVGCFASMAAIAAANQWASPAINLPLLVASFGASAVLLFGVPEGKLSQPRNFLGGHILSALVGVGLRAAMGGNLVWLSGSLATAMSLLLMQVTRTTHPPGGATALIAGSVAHVGSAHGFKFLLTVLVACAIMLPIALVVNNLSAHRRYPTYWL